MDTGTQLGGRLPLPQAPWPFEIAFSRQQLSKELGGFAAPVAAHVSGWLAEVAPVRRGTDSHFLRGDGHGEKRRREPQISDLKFQRLFVRTSSIFAELSAEDRRDDTVRDVRWVADLVLCTTQRSTCTAR